MKQYANFITWTIRSIIVFVAANLIIMGWGLWAGDETAQCIFLMCLAAILLLWPDPKDRTLNNSVKNIYKDGSRNKL